MTIDQGNLQTSVIEWGNFSIGADAAVNFKGPDGFNSLNYVANGGPISEIYGQLTALGGNIFIANPAGVQIGNSAQINVGSLYVTNKDVGEAVKHLGKTSEESDIISAIREHGVAETNAELMSLGAIVNAKNVTFDGGRIVLDTDRIYADNAGGELQPVDDAKLTGMLNIITNDKDNVVLGSSERAGIFNSFSINGGNDKLEKGYTWVHDLDELQAMDKNKSGWYALRNSIDANATAGGDYMGGAGFDPIGKMNNHFTGRFDGLGYSIFGLNINNRTTNNVGLFGYAQNATIRNFTLNSSEIKGGANTGAAVGHADGGKIENVTNTGNVTGGDGTGGIVGKAENKVAMSGLINIGKVTGGVGTGGVVGSMSGGTLGGDTYNLGSVTGTSSVGGIVGSVTNATIGNEVTQDNPDAFQIYNQLNVEGEYNVGGIAGTLSDSTITNAANYGNVTATGFTKEAYQYHKGNAEWINNNKDLKIDDNSLAYVSGVHVANTGGIVGSANGSELSKVENTGNVTTSTTQGDAQTGNYYNAGNIGGIVGRAEDTIINNAENKENFVAGAHNVGGVAGFLTGTSNINVASNNGGDITATGARTDSGFAREYVRGVPGSNENFIIGNIGGVVGYIFGEDAKVQNSGNRGTVHSAEIKGTTVLETAQAANVGGVVGKISSETIGTQEILEKIAEGELTATVSNSYNTGDVRGYTGVGGVVGQMFNGSISGSYNLGKLEATRTVDASSTMKESLNMGGIVGDTSEESKARAVIYDVYNAGQIGDEDFYFRGRHVGGIAGRLSGFVDKAYNTGDIYNGYSTVGGIAGWWFAGKISNVFNTGNITVKNFDAENKRAQVGGIVGDAGTYAESLIYAYNLGTIRSFAPFGYAHHVGGIAGRITDNLIIDNVYTLGNLYAATAQENANDLYTSTEENLGAIYGSGGTTNDKIKNANYITPDNPTDGTPTFKDLSEKSKLQDINVVAYENRSDTDVYELGGLEKLDTTTNWSVNDGAWRLYEEGTPILNEFTPYAEDYFSANHNGISSIQYGTAYNPMLTIVNIEKDSTLKVDWQELNMKGAGGLAVYGGNLTLTDFKSAGDGRYFGGTIFSEGKLNITGTGTNFNLGSASKLYGSSVTLTNGGDISAYGEITSTNGGIEITGKNVEIIGSLTAKAQGETTEIDGISGASRGRMDTTDLNDPNKPMKSVSEMFTYTTDEAKDHGDITVNASGAAEVLYGNLGTGSVSTAGEFTVKGGVQEDGTLSGGSVYVDSDLTGTTGDINLSAGGEVLLDITNIAKANSNEQGDNGKDALHKFLANYKEDGGDHKIILNSANDDVIIAIDMWNGSAFDLKQYDDKYNTDDTFRNAIRGLGGLASKTHIWISDAEQLKGIQDYYDSETDNGRQTDILNYNFALKNNIDASALEDYKAIGGEAGYSGTFDGRGFRIIGLNADATKADEASSGIFGTLAGTVKDLRVYASKFFGGDGKSAGAIASEVTEGGTITGVTTFGNRVEAANAGGIAGTNAGTITSSAASDSVITNGGTAGGIAGTNTGTIGAEEGTFVTAESAVTSGANDATAIGGVVGDNKGKVNLANSLGVTNGANVDKNVGGIAGDNSGTMYSLYNESVVTGNGSVGGVAGTNSGEIENAVNTTGITAPGDYAGGLAGVNSGTIDSGRNTGTINGTNNVGGMVGANEKGGTLENLSNAVTAAIFGGTNVGGIAGTNSGTITSDNNLVNEGTVYGNQYVGGIAGVNEQDGVIENVTSETLVLKTSRDDDAKYFGGIAGQNAGTITDATNESNVKAEGATYVGGIAGQNTDTGRLTGSLVNNGDVTGRSNVGGLAGENNNSSLLKGSADNPLRVTNNGTITATDGGAGGIFHTNTGDIEHAVLTNNGTIIAKGENANTGGLFGSNSGNIANSTLANSGEVNGGANTGGLIGENSGNASFSSLVNTGKVSGGDNTGGLIGLNTGTLTGGRGTGENGMTLYKYQIYNNGAVSGTDNVGGLIGYNDKGGALYAGYNTGTVNGDDSVGGIAGRNDGSVSSVFNTIMTADGANEIISAGSNAGGLVGFNAGTLTDGYNTTGVTNGGNAVGTNTGVISRVYATNTTGRLINNNSGTASNVYTFAAGDGSARFVSEAERMFSRFYGGFGFGSTWKNYDGWSTPMLKVFLTQAGYSADTELVQTGYPMSLPIKGYVVAGDNLIAYYNANALLVALANTELGDDYLAFYSTQIAASGEGALFNPNNLGYDIDVRYSIVPLFEYNAGHLHWLHRGGDRERNFRERKAEIYFHEGGMVHEEAL